MLIVPLDIEIRGFVSVVVFFSFREREKSLNDNQFRGNTLKSSYDVPDLLFLGLVRRMGK